MQDVEMDSKHSSDDADFLAHKKTYGFFIDAAKYGTIVIIALLIAMAAGLVGPLGFFSSLMIFIILSAIGIYSFR